MEVVENTHVGEVALCKECTRDYAESVSAHAVSARLSEPQSTHLISPKTGFEARTTTAFCTVERVTSASFTNSSAALICRLHLRAQYVKSVSRVCQDKCSRYSEYRGGIGTGWNQVEVGIVFGGLCSRCLIANSPRQNTLYSPGVHRPEEQGTAISSLFPHPRIPLLSRTLSWDPPNTALRM